MDPEYFRTKTRDADITMKHLLSWRNSVIPGDGDALPTYGTNLSQPFCDESDDADGA
jgi:hypothetical protein